MAKQKSITLNFIMNAILTMSSVIFPLITFPYVSRVLLTEGTGKVAFATSVVSYFAMFAQLGIPTYGIRACAKVRDDKEKLSKVVHELFLINLIMSIIAYIVFAAALFFVPRMREDGVLFLIISTTLIFNAIGVEWLYKALEQYSYITIRSIIFKFIALILMFLLVHQTDDYVIYGAITIFAASASNIFNFFKVHQYVSLRPLGEYDLKRHLKPVVVFFAMSCATTIYTNLDTVMLGFIRTDHEVGCYNAAVRIKTILVSVVTSLGTVLLPRASYYIDKGLKDEFRRIAQKALNFVFLVSIPMTVYFIMYAYECIIFFAGDAYYDSVLPMQIIMPTLFLIGLTNIMGIQMLVPLGKEKHVLYSEIAGAIVNLILNAVLIPEMGASGAAIGTLVAEAVVWLVQFVFLKEVVVKMYQSISYFRIVIAVIPAGIAAAATKLIAVPMFFQLAISAVVFFGIYALVLTLTKEPLVLELEDKLFGRFRKK